MLSDDSHPGFEEPLEFQPSLVCHSHLWYWPLNTQGFHFGVKDPEKKGLERYIVAKLLGCIHELDYIKLYCLSLGHK